MALDLEKKKDINQSDFFEIYSEVMIANANGYKKHGCFYNSINVNLRDCNLIDINFDNIDLRHADFSGCNIIRCNFCSGELGYADFTGSYIEDSRFYNTHFKETSFQGCMFKKCHMFQSDFSLCNFNDSHFDDATYLEISSCKFTRSNFRHVTNAPDRSIDMACPRFGAFVGYKKCVSDGCPAIVKLEIPADAKRSAGTGKKCRCDKAMVLQIETPDGKKFCSNTVYPKVYNDTDTVYEVGKIVKADSFTEDRFEECAHGIHFFMNRDDAVDYY